MCLNPVTISNNTHRFAVGKSKLSFDVPCGKCHDCRSSKKNEWFLRCYKEFQDCQSKGGATYFVTLTYADEFLPHFDIEYKKLVDGKVVYKHLDSPCFSYDDIHSFIKNLRTILKRRFGNIKLRYIVFPEYGDKYRRPHYHCLFYLSRKLANKDFFRCLDGYDNDVERRKFHKWSLNQPYFITPEHPDGFCKRGCWHKGWVLISKECKGGMLVKNQKSILYCSKYVTKDMSFFGQNDVVDFQNAIFDKTLYNDIERADIISKVSHSLPKHYNSPSLGFDYIKAEFMSDYNKYIKDGFVIATGQKSSVSYFIPDYYKRKILYRYDVQKDEYGNKKVVWYYSPDSKQIHLAYLRNSIRNYISKLDVIFSYDFVNSLQNDDLLHLGFDKVFLSSYLRDIRSKYTPYQIAVFSLVFHCRSSRFDCLDGCDEQHSLIHYISHYEDYYINFIDNNDDFDYREKYLDKHQYEYNYSYDCFDCFKGLSEFCALVSNINLCQRDYRVNFFNFINSYRDLFIPCESHKLPVFDVT